MKDALSFTGENCRIDISGLWERVGKDMAFAVAKLDALVQATDWDAIPAYDAIGEAYGVHTPSPQALKREELAAVAAAEYGVDPDELEFVWLHEMYDMEEAAE